MELAARPFLLRRAVLQTADLVKYQAEAKGLTITCTLKGKVPSTVVGDVMRFRQVLLNLLSNAVKFTVKGSIAVRVSCDFVEEASEASEGGVKLRVRVRDTGIGIQPASLPALFSMFSKVDTDNELVNNASGCGLGLAISSRLVHLMGGEISVASEPGSGSSFVFTVLCKPAPREFGGGGGGGSSGGGSGAGAGTGSSGLHSTTGSGSASDIADAELDEAEANAVLEDLDFADGTSAGALRRARHAAQVCRGKRVLLAEDNAFNAEIITAYLTASAVEVVWASNGEQAVRAFKAAVLEEGRPFDCVLMDCQVLSSAFSFFYLLATHSSTRVPTYFPRTSLLMLMDCQMPILDGWAATRELRRWEAGRSRAEAEAEDEERHGGNGGTNAAMTVMSDDAEEGDWEPRDGAAGETAEEEEEGGTPAGSSSSSSERRTPIVALTAYAMESDKARCLGAGMDVVVTKPVQRVVLTKVIAHLLRGAGGASSDSASEVSHGAGGEQPQPQPQASSSSTSAAALTASLNAHMHAQGDGSNSNPSWGATTGSSSDTTPNAARIDITGSRSLTSSSSLLGSGSNAGSTPKSHLRTLGGDVGGATGAGRIGSGSLGALSGVSGVSGLGGLGGLGGGGGGGGGSGMLNYQPAITAHLQAANYQPIDEALGQSQFGSSRAVYYKMMSKFAVEYLPQGFAAICTAAAAHDAISLRMEAHSLKGSAAFVGASALSETCERLMSVCGLEGEITQWQQKVCMVGVDRPRAPQANSLPPAPASPTPLAPAPTSHATTPRSLTPAPLLHLARSPPAAVHRPAHRAARGGVRDAQQLLRVHVRHHAARRARRPRQ
jgi:CheY-like chemotaxis protein/HPt (histidine-containing phosphotransfer) domain-containing protein